MTDLTYNSFRLSTVAKLVCPVPYARASQLLRPYLRPPAPQSYSTLLQFCDL
jgi:hypothetical protein